VPCSGKKLEESVIDGEGKVREVKKKSDVTMASDFFLLNCLAKNVRRKKAVCDQIYDL
jgi:hypothetical protein